MGTTFNIVIIHDTESEAHLAASKAIEEVKKLNGIFSNYIEDSEVSQLTTTPQRVSDDLWHLISVSLRLSKESNGAFDITIGPLSKLWRRAIRRSQSPSDQDISVAKSLVGYKKLILDKATHSVAFTHDGMSLDFGGIAKGYAVDQAYKSLISSGMTYALVDGGGDIYVGDHPDKGWKVELADRDSSIYLSQKAIAVSGPSYQNFKEKNSTYSHIVIPETGKGLRDSKDVIVTGPNCMIADGLATLLSIDKVNPNVMKAYEKYKLWLITEEDN